uniref:Uncharacterized protein n=1 Tax=Timema poppense TaxID=170557 RepID=A0A7R9CN90_TIMPO|nr:unnamed protein product [Timema poppensis]
MDVSGRKDLVENLVSGLISQEGHLNSIEDEGKASGKEMDSDATTEITRINTDTVRETTDTLTAVAQRETKIAKELESFSSIENKQVLCHILHPDTTEIDSSQIEKKEEAVEEETGLPVVRDPGIFASFIKIIDYEPEYDELGVKMYKETCKALNTAPVSKFIESLTKDAVVLKHHTVTARGIRAMAEALYQNQNVKILDLEEIMIDEMAAYFLGELLLENQNLVELNLSGCKLGSVGLEYLKVGISISRTMKKLNLSRNQLGDEGMVHLVEIISDNSSLKHLNLSHNDLGERSAQLLEEALEMNWSLEDLDLSWNSLYPRAGIMALMRGMSLNEGILKLDLSWNGLGMMHTGQALRNMLRKNKTLQMLNLSWNLMEALTVRLLRTGVLKSKSLQILKLAFNPIAPSDAIILCKTLLNPLTTLSELDLDGIWLNKDFLQAKPEVLGSFLGTFTFLYEALALEQGKLSLLKANILKLRDVKITVGGIYNNYKISVPDARKIHLARAKFEAQKPKKKKDRRDLGHFILKLGENPVLKTKFIKMIEDEKLKVEPELVQEIMNLFPDTKRAFVDVAAMKEYYLNLYPDTKPPEPKEKKEKKKKGKGKKGEEDKCYMISDMMTRLVGLRTEQWPWDAQSTAQVCEEEKRSNQCTGG